MGILVNKHEKCTIIIIHVIKFMLVISSFMLSIHSCYRFIYVIDSFIVIDSFMLTIHECIDSFMLSIHSCYNPIK